MEKIKLDSTEVFVIAELELESAIAEDLKNVNEEEDAKKLEALLAEQTKENDNATTGGN
jgi:hypothetical protein